MAKELHTEAARLLGESRWAALATLHEGHPLASMVAYAVGAERPELFFHLSGLSAHTTDLLGDPRSSLCVSRPDTGHGDPQVLPRLTVNGRAETLEPGTPEYDAARKLYLRRFPDAEMRFQLPDFVLFRFAIGDGRFVGGFARAIRLSAAQLSEASR